MKAMSLQPGAFYKPGSLGFLRSYFIHMRPYLLFVSGVAGVSGIAVSAYSLSHLSSVLCFWAFFLGYGFGQALTDCFQIDTDSISSPYRPLVRGIIRKKDVLLTSIAGLFIIGLTLIMHNLYNLPVFILSALGLLSYTYFKRNYSFLGPFWNSWIVMLLPVAGFLTTANDFTFAHVLNNKLILLLALMTFASYANFVLIGYLKDIQADRETGYKTFPVVFGWSKTVWAGNLNVAVSIILCAYLVSRSYNIYALAFLAAGSIIAVSGQVYAMFTKEKTEKNSAFPVAATVRSFILWHLSVILAFKPGMAAVLLAAVFYLFFELVIYARPQKEQI